MIRKNSSEKNSYSRKESMCRGQQLLFYHRFKLFQSCSFLLPLSSPHPCTRPTLETHCSDLENEVSRDLFGFKFLRLNKADPRSQDKGQWWIPFASLLLEVLLIHGGNCSWGKIMRKNHKQQEKKGKHHSDKPSAAKSILQDRVTNWFLVQPTHH